jgi:hypothetical protein
VSAASATAPRARKAAARAKPPPQVGSEAPRIWTKPRRRLTRASSRGFEVIDFAQDILGIELLPWQKWFLVHALELNADETYRFRTLLCLVARQNGKTTLVQVLALWRMFLDGCQLVLGTAQNLDVAEECWTGAVEMAQGVPELRDEIAQVVQVNGKKSMRLTTGERYKVQAANRRGGRGLSGNMVVLDELREHQTWEAWGAITKTTLAKTDAQVVGMSNAGDSSSVVLSHLRAVGLGELDDPDTSIGLFEWSAPEGCLVDDWEAIAQANPSLGHTIQPAAIEDALRTDPEGIFRTEVLCQWVENLQEGPIPRGTWDSRRDPLSTVDPRMPVAFAVDTSWDRQMSWIAVAGMRADGTPHVELVASHFGTEWVVGWLRERLDRYRVLGIAIQASGAPASSLLEPLIEAFGDKVVAMGGQDLARACGMLFDAVAEGPFAHLGQEQLDDAIERAVARPASDAWLWDRKTSPIDIAPIVAVTGAFYVLHTVSMPSARRSGRAVGF